MKTTMKKIPKPEVMWCVYGASGLYCASNCGTRKDAIQRHLSDLGVITWQERRKQGDYVAKVIITPTS